MLQVCYKRYLDHSNLFSHLNKLLSFLLGGEENTRHIW